MTCCKCEEFGWAYPAKTVWEDPEGQEYCIFHAPEQGKGVSKEEFNAHIFNTIRNSAKQNQVCDLSSTVFSWDIVFSNKSIELPAPSIDLSNAIFERAASFIGFKTNNKIILDNAIFKDVLTFHRSTLEGPSSFTYITCDGKVLLRYCKINDTEGFNSAIFGSPVEINSVEFNNADFNFATFEDTLTIRYTDFFENSYFENTTFKGNVKIIGTTFNNTTFRWSNFLSEAAFICATFSKIAVFTQATFAGETSFLNCETSESHMILREISILHRISFSRIDLRKTSFLFTDLEKIQFHNVKWQTSSHGTRLISSVEGHLQSNIDSDGKNIDADVLQDTISFYRQMKKKARDNSDDEEASQWHYSEKELRLRKLKNNKNLSFQRAILEIYRIISRYGEDPLQAAEVLFYLALLLLASLALGGLYALGEPPFDITASRVAKGLRAFAQYALFMKPDWSPPAFFDFIAILLSRLLIPIQAAIFAFALRNKLHR